MTDKERMENKEERAKRLRRERNRRYYYKDVEATRKRQRDNQRRYRRTNPNIKEIDSNKNKRDSYKRRCNYKVYQEIAMGRMQKPVICSLCGKRKVIFAHHNDYSKPLEVMWVCRECHNIIHKLIDAGFVHKDSIAEIRLDNIRQAVFRENADLKQKARKMP